MTETGFGMIWNKENVQDDYPENNETILEIGLSLII